MLLRAAAAQKLPAQAESLHICTAHVFASSLFCNGDASLDLCVVRRPNLGAKAFNAGWYFDFNLAYVGAGFITPLSVRLNPITELSTSDLRKHLQAHDFWRVLLGTAGLKTQLDIPFLCPCSFRWTIGLTVALAVQVNYSMMVGAILSWGIAWPLINNRAGSWYPADLPSPTNNFQGAFAYHVRPSSSSNPLHPAHLLFKQNISLCPELLRVQLVALHACHSLWCFRPLHQSCSDLSSAGLTVYMTCDAGVLGHRAVPG